jgi:HD-GYP domain-containing protein (c-di-GMP phosphodiesterase class II)
VNSLLNISRLPNRDSDSLSALLADDERVTESVSELLQLLRVRVGPYIADHSMATALWSASIARVMGLNVEGVFTAGVVGALHEVGSLLVVPPTEAESLRMAESRFMLEKARFRLATIDVLASIPVLKRFAVTVAEIYTDTVRAPVARIVAVADWYDWFCSPGDGQRPAYSSRDALTYLERNAGVRFHPDVVVALRELTSGFYRDDDLEFA